MNCAIRKTDQLRLEVAIENRKGSALDGNDEIQQGRRACLLELALDGVVDDLLDVRAAVAASQAGTRRARDITGRARAVFDEATNLSICDSAAMANEHPCVSSMSVDLVIRIR